MSSDLKARVLTALARSEPLTIAQIAQRTGLSKPTAAKYVHILAAERKIIIKKYGNMLLCRRR